MLRIVAFLLGNWELQCRKAWRLLHIPAASQEVTMLLVSVDAFGWRSFVSDIDTVVQYLF